MHSWCVHSLRKDSDIQIKIAPSRRIGVTFNIQLILPRNRRRIVDGRSETDGGTSQIHPSLGNARQAWYDRDDYKSSPTSDPTGPAEGSYCVFRGGGCDGTVAACRSAFRNRHSPSFRAPYVKFSLGLAPPSHAINVLNGWVRRFARSVSMANWRASSFWSGASDRFGVFLENFRPNTLLAGVSGLWTI